MTAAKRSAEQAVLSALDQQQEVSAVELAAAHGRAPLDSRQGAVLSASKSANGSGSDTSHGPDEHILARERRQVIQFACALLATQRADLGCKWIRNAPAARPTKNRVASPLTGGSPDAA
jgi:hypothetical protein